MIVHPVFTLLGLNDGNATIGEGLVVILLYVVIGLTALAIDRRALLVSALALLAAVTGLCVGCELYVVARRFMTRGRIPHRRTAAPPVEVRT